MVKVTNSGKLEITDVVNDKMAGLEGEISKEEFFNTIAGYVNTFRKNRQDWFCFSYPSEILPNRDAGFYILQRSAGSRVVGQLIGRNLLEALAC